MVRSKLLTILASFVRSYNASFYCALRVCTPDKNEKLSFLSGVQTLEPIPPRATLITFRRSSVVEQSAVTLNVMF